MKIFNNIRINLGIILLFLLSIDCAYQPVPTQYNVPGFFQGLLHGFIVFFSLIGSIFGKYRIYAFPNSGFWYDLGFFIGFGTWVAVINKLTSAKSE